MPGVQTHPASTERETMIKLVLFYTDRRAETWSPVTLHEARLIAKGHVGNTPKFEGNGMFGYAFNSVTGRSLRVIGDAKLADLFEVAA